MGNAATKRKQIKLKIESLLSELLTVIPSLYRHACMSDGGIEEKYKLITKIQKVASIIHHNQDLKDVNRLLNEISITINSILYPPDYFIGGTSNNIASTNIKDIIKLFQRYAKMENVLQLENERLRKENERLRQKG